MVWHFPLEMLKSCVLTIIIETLATFLLKYRKKDLLLVSLVNLLTNPLVNGVSFFCLIMYGRRFLVTVTIIVELAAFVSEGFIYQKYIERRNIHPFLLSFILNALSFSAGFIIP